jgi:bla regulator protein blaR1
MPPAVMHASSQWPVFVLDAAFRSSLLGCFLAAVLGALRVRAARAKLLVWRGMLMVALAMPLLMLLSPAVPLAIPVPNFSRNAAIAGVRAVPPAPAFAMVPARLREGDRIARQPNDLAPAAPLAQRPSSNSSADTGVAVSWRLLATGVYLAFALFFLARVLIGVYFARRLAHSSAPVDDADALQMLSAASRASGLRLAPSLGESDMLSVPVTFGVRNPAILLPSTWREWDGDELAAVLAHEVSHAAGHDSLVQLLAVLHRALFWFSPLSWWLACHLADLAEQTSDEATLASGADRTRYAEALLGFLADLETSPSRVWWHGAAMAKAGRGERRVERILAWRSAMSHKVSKSLAVALIAICVPAVALVVSAHPSAYSLQEAAVLPPAAPLAPPPPNQLAPSAQADPVAPAAPVAVPVVPGAPVPAEAPQVALPVAPSAPEPGEPPQISSPPAPPSPIAPPAGGSNEVGIGVWPVPYWGWGPRFVIVTRGSDHLIMSGSEADAEHARELRTRIPGDFIWFERDGKSYVIRDPGVIGRARQIWTQRGDDAKLQQQLQEKQQELSREMREQVQQKMEEIRVKIPDMTAELQKLQSEIKELNAKGATLQQLGDLQREVGGLQQALGEARWNSNMQNINRQAAEIGRQMGELGRQIGEIARQEVERGRQAAEQMRQLLENAFADGLAKPE